MEEALLIGSLDAAKTEFKTESLDLRAFARRLVDEMLSATDRRCPIELLLGEIPARIQADERLLRHIFTNLLTNAVKYSEPCCTRSDVTRRKSLVLSKIGGSVFRRTTRSGSSMRSIAGTMLPTVRGRASALSL